MRRSSLHGVFFTGFLIFGAMSFLAPIAGLPLLLLNTIGWSIWKLCGGEEWIFDGSPPSTYDFMYDPMTTDTERWAYIRAERLAAERKEAELTGSHFLEAVGVKSRKPRSPLA